MLCLGGAVCSSNCISLVLPTLLQSRSGEQSSPKQHDMLAALQAEERRQAEQGPPQQAALAQRIERAKALRPCASLACPHLAANPQLRGKLCTGCRTVRYCCADDQAHDWKSGGHCAACRLLQQDGGSGSSSGSGV